MVAAALASLILAARLVGFSAWPAGSSSSLPAVIVPAVATPVPSGAAGRAAAVTLPAVRAAPAPRRAATRTLARPVSRQGAVPVAPVTRPAGAGTAPAAPAPSAPPVTRQVTSTLADTTSAVTRQAGATVGGPIGSAIASTGESVAQTLDDVGALTQPILGS